MQSYRPNNKLSFLAAIHDYAETGNLEGYRKEVANGVDPNLKDDKNGWTPLHFAVRFRQHNIVEDAVKDKRVNVNATDMFGCVPLDVACGLSDRKSEQYLLSREDIDVNHVSRIGSYPLYSAMFNAVWDYHYLVDLCRKKSPDADTHNIDLAYKKELEYGNEDSDAIVCDLLNHEKIDLTKRDSIRNNKLILDLAEEHFSDALWLNTLREKTQSQLAQNKSNRSTDRN